MKSSIYKTLRFLVIAISIFGNLYAEDSSGEYYENLLKKKRESKQYDKIELFRISDFIKGITPIEDIRLTGYTFDSKSSYEYYMGKDVKDEFRGKKRMLVRPKVEDKERINKKLGKKLYNLVPIRAIHALAPDWVDGEVVYMLDLSAKNRYSWGLCDFQEEEYVLDNNLMIWDTKEPFHFSYEYLGSFSNGVHVLQINENGGGTLTSNDLIFLIFEKIKSFDGKTKILLRSLGHIPLCDVEDFIELSFKEDVLIVDYISNNGFKDYSSLERKLKKISK